MTLFDAARPSLSGRPMLLNAPCVVPGLTLWPEPGPRPAPEPDPKAGPRPAPGPAPVRLTFWLPVNSNQFSEFSAVLPTDQIPNAILDFTNDPEDFLARAVNWHGMRSEPAKPPAPAKPPSTDDSLASLGLF